MEFIALKESMMNEGGSKLDFCGQLWRTCLGFICLLTSGTLLGGSALWSCRLEADELPDIRSLSSHFTDPSGDFGPWQFSPASNIRELSADEHPGMVTLWEAGNGQDIKGLLQKPIKISDYPLPWEFHLGMVQNCLARKGLSEGQINYAIGLNLVVTFSDPSEWPEDRTKLPPDTHSSQVFVVHLGSIGENYRQGVPQLKRTPLNQFDHSPEAYWVYGRGDLAANLNGNWNMGYTWVGTDPSDAGTWSKRGGPAHPFIRFRVSMLSPNSLIVGVGYGDHPGWRQRVVDLSKFGNITGIWEIGPIISLDRWIPDTLAKDLDLNQPEWLESFKQRQRVLSVGTPEETQQLQKKQTEELASNFEIDSPNPQFQYFVDYAVFYGNGPDNIEHLSEEFDIPGFLADQKYYVEGNAICETHSNPGYLTATLYGTNSSWAMCPILRDGGVNFEHREPPFELEISFIPPAGSAPWNLWWNVGFYDRDKKMHSWQPGIKRLPDGSVRYFDVWQLEPDAIQTNPLTNFQFPAEMSKEVLSRSPLFMLLQFRDQTHVRVGFKNKADNPWVFSSTFDATTAFGPITMLSYPCLVSFTGRNVGGKGWGAGNFPEFQKIKIDYWRFRYSLSD